MAWGLELERRARDPEISWLGTISQGVSFLIWDWNISRFDKEILNSNTFHGMDDGRKALNNFQKYRFLRRITIVI